ncbi:hypothetical protein [Paraburkholderia sp. HP33-1]|uniref:hypothetical protein n=1 Tax=Paraburkholderia sp. HP33-1 TaxID=2883243 RepID=UPI001F1DDDD7|nr:hypothetical protein [Paraburkholderia sp. HP33-1]
MVTINGGLWYQTDVIGAFPLREMAICIPASIPLHLFIPRCCPIRHRMKTEAPDLRIARTDKTKYEARAVVRQVSIGIVDL